MFQIPYLKQIRKVILSFVIIIPFSVFLFPREEALYGQIGWYMLIGVMLIRPVSDVFPFIKLFKTLVPLRKEFGIGSYMFILAHFVAFPLMQNQSILKTIITPDYWNLGNIYGWGMWGLAVALPVFLTSNIFSIIKLKKWWKYVQRLAYPFFILGGIHVYLVKGMELFWPVIVVAVFWILACGMKVYKTSRTTLI